MILFLLLFGLGLFVFLTVDWGISLMVGFHKIGQVELFCPGCGGSRSLNYLLQGQLLNAWRSNQLFVTLLPLLACAGFVLFRSLLTGYPLTTVHLSEYWLWLLVAVIILFTVCRNLPFPAFDYLRPPPAG